MQTRMGQGRFTELDRYMGAAQGGAKRAAALTHRLLAFGLRRERCVGNGHLAPGMEVLTKPFAIEALASRIKNMIAKGGTSA